MNKTNIDDKHSTRLRYNVSPIVTRRRKNEVIVKVDRIPKSVKIPTNFSFSDDSEEENYSSPKKSRKSLRTSGYLRPTRLRDLSDRSESDIECGEEDTKVEKGTTSPEYLMRTRKNSKSTKELIACCTPQKIRIKPYCNDSPRSKLSDALEKVSIGSTRRSILKKISSNCTPKKSVTYSYVSDEKSSVNTPKKQTSKKISRESLLTPSIQNRLKTITKGRDSLSLACTQLHVSYVPKCLPCRDKEFSDIFSFLQGKLNDGIGGCMYISGVPGTGKTATVTETIKKLQKSSVDGELPAFLFVSINGMKLSEPRQAYVEIIKQLDGKNVRWEQAQTMLENKFCKGSRKGKPVVLVVDELDILCTKRQDVVYNLLDWPTKSQAQLIVITIANTMDLPERLLMSRVTSRLGLTRLTFQPYNFKQLQEIIAKRLLGTNIFNPDAVQLVSRKVASVSGDARRALDICRRAAEIAQQEGPETLVDMNHVSAALNAMITQPKIQAISHCSQLEKLLLQSVVAEVERTGVEESKFDSVYKMFQSLATIEGFRGVPVTVALSAIVRLGSSRLLLIDNKFSNIHKKIVLNVSSDDVYYALKAT